MYPAKCLVISGAAAPFRMQFCKNALKVFESIGCVVEEAVPDYPLDAVWNAALRLRSWQQGSALLE